jgi:hypothetical protein
MHAVHTDDVAGSLWAGAVWMASNGRKAADALAGEEIISYNNIVVDGMPPLDKKVIAPMFNVVSFELFVIFGFSIK